MPIEASEPRLMGAGSQPGSSVSFEVKSAGPLETFPTALFLLLAFTLAVGGFAGEALAEFPVSPLHGRLRLWFRN